MAQELEANVTDKMISSIMTEMTSPIECILGGPVVQPLDGCTSENGSTDAKTSSQGRWRMAAGRPLPPIPRIRSHIAPSQGWEERTGISSMTSLRTPTENRRSWRLPSPLRNSAKAGLISLRSVQQVGSAGGGQGRVKAQSGLVYRPEGEDFALTNYPSGRKPPRDDSTGGSAGKGGSSMQSRRAAVQTSLGYKFRNTGGKQGHGMVVQEQEEKFRALKARSSALYISGRYDKYEQEVRAALQSGFELCVSLEHELTKLRHSEPAAWQLGRGQEQKRRVVGQYEEVGGAFAAGEMKRLAELGRAKSVGYFAECMRRMQMRKMGVEAVWEDGRRARLEEVGKRVEEALREGKEEVVLVGVEEMRAVLRVSLQYRLVGVMLEAGMDVPEGCAVA